MKWIIIILLALLTVLTGCTTDSPRLTKVNGHTVSQTDKRFLGIKVWTSENEILTADQEREKIELDKERREADLDLKAEERQSAFAFYLGAGCILAAVGCVVAGYFFKGWKFWGGLSMLCGGMGALAFGAEQTIGYLKWLVGIPVAAMVLWSMWKLKDFSGAEMTREKLAELSRKRKQETPGD